LRVSRENSPRHGVLICHRAREPLVSLAAPVVHPKTDSNPAALDDRPPSRSQTGSSSHTRVISTEFLRSASRPVLSSGAPSTQICRPRRDIIRSVHRLRGVQPPLRSAHRFSQPLDGLLRFELCGLLSSRCHVQGSSTSPIGSASPNRQTPHMIAKSIGLVSGDRHDGDHFF